MQISPNRITGLATGLDTDALVKQSLKPYQMKIDKVNQDKQIIQWKQDLYREILGDVNNFKSTYFDVLKSDTYMLSPNSFAGYDVATTGSTTINSSGATIEALNGAVVGDYKVTVNALAEGAIVKGTKVVDKDGKDVLRNTKLTDLNIDTTKSFVLDYGSAGVDGTGKINTPTTYTITPKADMTVQGLIDAVSTATKGNVKLSFSELNGEFKIETTKTGNNAVMQLKSGDWDKLNLADITVKKGSPAKVVIKAPGMADGNEVTLEKDTNSFTVDGIRYNLTKVGTDSTTINVKSNITKPFDKIVSFVKKYNELIEKIDLKANEKKQYTYVPLTEEQKKDMSEEEIKRWEDRAKEGLLKGDSNLRNMISELRRAVYSGVKDAGINITEIGITTFEETSQRGKLKIDESKLKDALQKNPDKVANIFTKSSKSVPDYDPNSNQANKKTRWDEEGILKRFEDILKDYTRTIRDDNGKKGILIEKAGIKGDLSEFKNILTEDIMKKDTLIREMQKKLYQRENRLYSQFAQLEKAMSQMNSQSSWLMQQFGGGA